MNPYLVSYFQEGEEKKEEMEFGERYDDLHSITSNILNDQNIIVTGLCWDDEDEIDKIFEIKFNQFGDLEDAKTLFFSLAKKEEIIEDKKARKKRKRFLKSIDEVEYQHINTLIKSDGARVFIGQITYFSDRQSHSSMGKPNFGPRRTPIKSELFVVDYQAEGELNNFHWITQLLHITDNGSATIQMNDELFIIFNDHPAVQDKVLHDDKVYTTFTYPEASIIHIDSKGNISKGPLFPEEADMKKIITNEFHSISNNEFIIMSREKSNGKLMKFELKK